MQKTSVGNFKHNLTQITICYIEAIYFTSKVKSSEKYSKQLVNNARQETRIHLRIIGRPYGAGYVVKKWWIVYVGGN